jgi:dUTP pyrophosphatase
MIQVKRIDENAKLPTKAHAGDLGYDLYSIEDVSLQPLESKIIRTGIAVKLPIGMGGIIKDRSSLAAKGIRTSGGVIDNGYMGEILIIMTNYSAEDYWINRGDKIAQMVLIPVTEYRVWEVPNFMNDSDTRGTGGFGSTGS